MTKYSMERLNPFWNADALWNFYLHKSCMFHIAGRTGWFEHLAAGSPPSTACPPAAHHCCLHQQCHWSCILLAHISSQNHPAAGLSETRVGCQIPGRQLGSTGILMWRRWKLLPASPSLSVNDEHLRWDTVTVKIANWNNKSFHQMFCATLGNFPSNCRNLFNFFFSTNQHLINVLDGLLSLLLQRLLGWRGGCCAARQSFFLFYVVVVLFLQVIFPLGFSFCFLEDSYFSACSAPQIPASFLVPAGIFKGFWHFYAFFVCVPTVREMSGFLICLIWNPVKLKWDPDKELAWELAWDLW